MRIRSAALVVFCGAVLLTACNSSAPPSQTVVGGNAARGARSIARYGCGSCHTIGGIPRAYGMVGPPLTGLRNRMYVAGILANNPENLQHWIRSPKELNPKTAMPQLGVSEHDAADIAAYIYSIPQ